jgi:hypothetical protein
MHGPGGDAGVLRASGEVSGRKLKLFALACCRRQWSSLRELEKNALTVAERFADGLADIRQLQAALDAAPKVVQAARFATASTCTDALQVANGLMGFAANAAPTQAAAARHAEGLVQCCLLRDIFGPLPFRRMAVWPSVPAGEKGAIVRLSQAAYDNRSLPEGALANDRLAVLADALEEAGCTDGEILGHSRGPGGHVRGCWLVDALVGKS